MKFICQQGDDFTHRERSRSQECCFDFIAAASIMAAFDSCSKMRVKSDEIPILGTILDRGPSKNKQQTRNRRTCKLNKRRNDPQKAFWQIKYLRLGCSKPILPPGGQFVLESAVMDSPHCCCQGFHSRLCCCCFFFPSSDYSFFLFPHCFGFYQRKFLPAREMRRKSRLRG